MEDHNRRFAKTPISTEDKHRPIPNYMLYDRVEPKAKQDLLPQGQIVTENKFPGDVLEYAKQRAAELPQIKRSRNAPRRTNLKYMSEETIQTRHF